MRVIKLVNKTPLPENVDNIRLFGAMYSALIELNKQKASVFRNKVSSGEIKISSAFPFKGTCLYFPKPIKPEKIEERGKYDIKTFICMKKFKDIKYVKQEGLDKYLKVKIYNEKFVKERVCSEKMATSGKSDKKNGDFEIEKTIIPRNTLNRITLESNIFYEHYTYIKNGGLWFGLDCNDTDLKNIIEPALRFLEDRGLGPNYSVGFGQFRFKHGESISFNLQDFNGYMSLSKIIPSNNDLNNLSGFWSIKEFKTITKDGFHVYINLFTEGSVFANQINGELYDKVYNYLINGKAFLIPCNVEVEENGS